MGWVSPTADRITRLTLFDMSAMSLNEDPLPEEITLDERVRIMTGDITMTGIAEELIDHEDIALIHMASMVSGNTEADPDEGW